MVWRQAQGISLGQAASCPFHCLKFSTCVPVKKEVGHGGEEREGSGPQLLSRGRVQELGVPEMGPLPQAFISFLQLAILGEVSEEGFSRIFISSLGVSFQGHGPL